MGLLLLRTGAVISPNIMALALKYAHWNVQIGILGTKAMTEAYLAGKGIGK